MGAIPQSPAGGSSGPLLVSLSALSQRLQQKIAPRVSSSAKSSVLAEGGSGERVEELLPERRWKWGVLLGGEADFWQ